MAQRLTRNCLAELRAAGHFVGIAGNQTERAGRFIRELNLPADLIATSDDWGVTKPDVAFFEKLIEISGHRPEEIAYVGDRLDNDIAPAIKAGLFTVWLFTVWLFTVWLFTVWLRRGPWGYVIQTNDTASPSAPREVAPTIRLNTLVDLRIHLGRVAR